MINLCLNEPMMEKRKILLLSDHAMSTSGVGVQSRWLSFGLLEKKRWTIRQLGAAVKHSNYDVLPVTEDFIIKPVDGFGSPEAMKLILTTEKPDVVLIFTDPRYFIWLWEMEEEVHQICPIAYWHLWDNGPAPTFNKVLYESTDLLNCINWPTYRFCACCPHHSRTLNILSEAGIRTVGGLARKKEEDLLSIEGVGKKAVQEIRRSLGNYGLILK